jgi:hypothetical protein
MPAHHATVLPGACVAATLRDIVTAKLDLDWVVVE